MVDAHVFSYVKNLLLDVGCVRVPNVFTDEDIEEIILSIYEFTDFSFDIEVVTFLDCYYLYIDTEKNVERFRFMLSLEICSMDRKMKSFDNAMSNVLNVYFKDNSKS